MDDVEDLDYRMELFRNSPGYKWPKVVPSETKPKKTIKDKPKIIVKLKF